MRFNRKAANDNRYAWVSHLFEKRDRNLPLPERTAQEIEALQKMMFSVINSALQPNDTVASIIMMDSERYTKSISDIVSFSAHLKQNASNDSLPPIGLSHTSSIETAKESITQQIIRLLTTVYNDIDSKAQNRKDFIADIKRLDFQGKLPEKIYAIKYKLSQLLNLPDAATWEHIIVKLEKDNPKQNWVNVA